MEMSSPRQRRYWRAELPFKWGDLGRRVAKLKEGDTIVLEREGDLTEEARKYATVLTTSVPACWSGAP